MTYLLVLLALLGCMALLDARWKLFFWARPWTAAAVLAAGIAYFLAWDVRAIAEGIFLHRDSPLMTGIMLGPQLPLEEAFFLAFLCYQAMVLFTGTLALLRHRSAPRAASRPAPAPAGSAEPSRSTRPAGTTTPTGTEDSA